MMGTNYKSAHEPAMRHLGWITADELRNGAMCPAAAAFKTLHEGLWDKFVDDITDSPSLRFFSTVSHEFSCAADWVELADEYGVDPVTADKEHKPPYDPKVLLEKRHDWSFRWHEPWPAKSADGGDLSAHIVLRASIHDCINMTRLVWEAGGHPHFGMDEELMLDFYAVHWAAVVTTSP